MADAHREGETSAERLRALYRFMAPRSFVASYEELSGEGFGASRIKNWRRCGRLVRVMWGVYSYGRDVETRQAAMRAALAAVGEGSVLTGRSACEVWGITEPRHKLPRIVYIGTESGDARVLRGLSPALRQTRVKVVSRQFKPGEVIRKDGLNLTKPALALIDLAVEASEREVRFAFLEACRLKLFQRGEVDYCNRKVAGRRGARKLKPLLALWVPELSRVRSVFEGMYLLALVAERHPVPKVNVRVFGYEVDLYWPEYRLVVELDGAAFHGDPVQQSIDDVKQRDLEANGLTVVRVTYREFDLDQSAAIGLAAVHLVSR